MDSHWRQGAFHNTITTLNQQNREYYSPGRFAPIMISKIQEKYRLTGKEIPIQYIHHFDGPGQYHRGQK